jgi:hypothetical protein
LQRVNGKSHYQEFYPEGGSYTTWITDPSSSGDSDADKENHPPSTLHEHASSRYHGHENAHVSSSRRRLDDDDIYSIDAPNPVNRASMALAEPASPPFFASQPILSDPKEVSEENEAEPADNN